MNGKTIKKTLRKTIDAWLESIENETVRKQVAANTIVTGGCIASLLLKEEVVDFDLYFRTKEAAILIAEYYVRKFQPKNKAGIPCAISVWKEDDRVKIVIKSAGIASEGGSEKPYEYFESRAEGEAGKYIESVMTDPGEIQDTVDAAKENPAPDDKPPFRPVFLSTNAITLSNKIQIVLRFFGDPDTIHENYDFTHCTNYWTSWDDELVLRQDALECLLAKELRYQGSKYPVCSVFRLRKFLKRGWNINAGQILKMAMQISKLDLEDITVLQDQLTGVDCAYFCEVISKLKEKDPQKVNCTYLVEILDRMF